MSKADRHREAAIELPGEREFRVDEYPGGDMLITNGEKELYLSSSESKALRSALGSIDGSKRTQTNDA